MEYGGYIEFEHFRGAMFHEKALHLNCGRRAFSYLILCHNIKRIWVPRFTCGSVFEPFKKSGVEILTYTVGPDFLPRLGSIPHDDWVLIINYYGQITNEAIASFNEDHSKLIIDNSQAYFQMPVLGVDTVYTCRKFFGVTDGAVLYTDSIIEKTFERDESFQRMAYLLGRFERSASEFYELYDKNNVFFDNEPIKWMSKLTHNILCGLDYDYIKNRRTDNFRYYNERFGSINKLHLKVPEGAYMYPLLVDDGNLIRKRLQKKKIYIPILWPDVLDTCQETDNEFYLAQNILPLPVDQRYDENDIKHVAEETIKTISEIKALET